MARLRRDWRAWRLAAGLVLAGAAIAPLPLAAQAAGAPAAAGFEAEIATWAEADREGDPAAALADLVALKDRIEAAGTPVAPRALGELYAMIGAASYALQDLAASNGWFDRAAEQYARDGNAPDKVAEIALNRAIALRRANRLDEAEAAAREALAIRREIHSGAHTEIASALGILANVLYSRGRYEAALGEARAALAEQRAADPGDALAIVQRLDSLAALLDESGRDEEALRVARQAQELARDALGREHAWYGYATNTLGQVLLDLARYEEAIPVIRETLAVRYASLGAEHPYTAASQMTLAVALRESGRREEARELAAAAMPVLLQHRNLMDPNMVAGFHRLRATLAAELGDWAAYDALIAEAGTDVDTALEADNPARAIFWLHNAHQLHRRGRNAEALALAERFVPVLRARLIAANNDRIFGEMLLARLRQAQGAAMADEWIWVDAVADELVGKLANIRLTNRELALEAEANAPALLLYFETARAAGDDRRAFDALQLLTLSDISLGQQRSSGTADEGSAEAAHARLAETARALRLAQRRSDAEPGGDAEDIARLRGTLDAAEADLRARFPDYVARFRPRPVALVDLQRGLSPGDLLVIPLEAQERGWVATIGHSGPIAWHELDMAALRGAAARLRGALEGGPGSGAFPLADAAALYRLVLPRGIGAHDRLLVHGGRLLASLPAAMFLTEDYAGPLAQAPWLVRRASVQVVGNLALFGAAERASTAPRAAPRFAGIGGAQPPAGERRGGVELATLFRSGRPSTRTIADLPPLTSAEAELRRIAEALPGEALLLVGPDAAEENVKRADLSAASVIAFATHGLVAGELRGLWEPALLLGTGDPESGEDGLLGASEIARLRLDADWVILSACNTAAGADGGAPAYSGLATAFAQAGARSLMLSHWRVRDDAAAHLSVGAVRGAAAGLPRAAALRAAQLALMADPTVPDAAHPALWAPFVIVEN